MDMIGISSWGLFFAVLLLAIPGYVLWRVSPALLGRIGKAVLRMVAQLAVVGTYLYWMFRWDSFLIDLLWLVSMLAAGAFSICRHTRLRRRTLVVPLIVGQLLPVIIVGIYVAFLIFHPEKPLSARWMVALFGLLLYEVQRVVAVGVEVYYTRLRHNFQLYDFLVGNGASHWEAVMPFVKLAVEKALAPISASMAEAGIVTLPLLTLGQVLAGVSPVVAVAYTVVVMIASLTVSVASLLLALYLADRNTFDSYGRMKEVVMKG